MTMKKNPSRLIPSNALNETQRKSLGLKRVTEHPEAESDGYVVLGCRSMDEGIWCVAADWKAESHNDPIEDYITNWMPYSVPSSAV